MEQSKTRLTKNNEYYQRIKKEQTNTKSYFILDNGGRLFLVYVKKDDSAVSIYKEDTDFYIEDDDKAKNYSHNKWFFTKLVKTFNKPLKIFIGKSPLNNMTRFSGGYGSRFDGNSILIQLSPKKYIYIGSEIEEFTISKQIKKYISPVGNNGVPYPYGIDEENNYYLFLEKVSISNIPKEYSDDPYEYYYKAGLITIDESFIPPIQPIIQNFNDIESFYIGKDKYTLTYVPYPKKDYQRTIKNMKEKMSVKKIDGKKYILDEKKYVKMMREFGKMMGFQPLKFKIIQERIFN